MPGLSAWDLDKSGASNAIAEPFMALTVREARQPLLPAINAVIKGEWYRPVVRFFRREGYAAVLPGRPLQTWWKYLYIRSYLLRIALYRLMRRQWYD